MHPHPNYNPKVKSNITPSFLKIVPCFVYLSRFPHNDIITFVCKHLYHPWCALMHFKHSSKCANPHCKTNMSLEWFKNFGFREFDKDLLEKEISKGCEASRLQQFNLRRQVTFANYPNVGKLWLQSSWHWKILRLLLFNISTFCINIVKCWCSHLEWGRYLDSQIPLFEIRFYFSWK